MIRTRHEVPAKVKAIDMAKLKFGVWIPSYASNDSARLERIRTSIRKCEEYGINVWVIDHLLTSPGLYSVSWLEPIEMLSYAAAITSRVKLATGILVLPVRNPVVLAKEVATLCALSGERLMLGVGPGWNAQEFAATGSRIEERGRRCDEMIESLSLLLTRSNATFTGRYYNFEDVTLDPRPSRMPELWVGGGSKIPDLQGHDRPKLAKTVADRIVKAGHWLSRAAGSQEMVKRDWQLLREHSRAMGKNPDSLVFGHCNFIHLVDTADEEKAAAESREPFLRVMGGYREWDHLRTSYFIGSVDRIRARIADLVYAGLQYLVLGPVSDDPVQIDLINKHIVAAFA